MVKYHGLAHRHLMPSGFLMRPLLNGGTLGGRPMLAWDDLKAEFTWEGSWRDICVTGTSIADWRAALEMIHAAGFRLKFMTDGAESTPPDNLLQVFNQPRECSFMLAAFVGGVQLNCHFFGESEIEFDLDPREVVGQAELDAVVTFMSKLAASTQKSALMTPENTHQAAFIRVAPSGIVQYISTNGSFQELAAGRS